MAVGSIAGAWGYLELGREATINKRDDSATCGAAIPTPPAQLLQLSHQSVLDALILDIVYQLGWRAQYWITKLNDLQYFSHNKLCCQLSLRTGSASSRTAATCADRLRCIYYCWLPTVLRSTNR